MENIRWETFVELSDQRHGSVPRMAYDRGDRKLISPLRLHEQIQGFIGRLIETFSEVRNIEMVAVASTTFKRTDLSQAFEADESYCISNVESILHKQDVDLAIDPPPELVIEVEITK
jgi:Uma2 family endonuclease